MIAFVITEIQSIRPMIDDGQVELLMKQSGRVLGITKVAK